MGASSLLGRVLEDQVSMVQVTSGGGEPSMMMQSAAWFACSGVEANDDYV